MADRSTGPVKPPVIDLTARSSARADSESRSEAASSPHQDNPRRPASASPFEGANWQLLGGVAAGGAVLGTLLTYLLSTMLHADPSSTRLAAAHS